MQTIADRLDAYLLEMGADGAWWARSNCLLFPARWVASERGAYDVSRWIVERRSRYEAARLLRAAGGIEALFAREMAAAGLVETDPRAAGIGAVGLIGLPRARGEAIIGCIRTPRHWAVRTIEGVARLGAETIAVPPRRVWSV